MAQNNKNKKTTLGEKLQNGARSLLEKSPYALDESELGQSVPEAEAGTEFAGLGDNPFALTAEEQRQIAEAQQNAPEHASKHHWYGVPVGTLVLCFALVGFAWLCTMVGQYIHGVVTDDSVERAYDSYLTPVVMFDPQPFESLSAADKAMIQKTAVWKTVFDKLDDIDEYDDQARWVCPADLVRQSAVQLFGVSCLLTPETFTMKDYNSGTEITIMYTDETDTYHIPLMQAVGTYQPYVVSKKARNGVTLLKVAYGVYIDLGSVTDPDVEIVGENLAVVKYMEYEIAHDRDTDMDYIKAIRTVN
jgi:hypothetical protein